MPKGPSLTGLTELGYSEGKGVRHLTLLMKVTSSQSPLVLDGKQRLLGVPLRTQPRDAAVAVHPFVNFGFACEPRDLDGFDPRILG
jgi:hypothetical protein